LHHFQNGGFLSALIVCIALCDLVVTPSDILLNTFAIMSTDEKRVDDGRADASTPSESDIEVIPGTINEKRLLRILDLRLLPAVSILYLLSFLDRSNVANARIEGLIDDLHMTGNEYLTGLTLYFLGYVLFELPCNIILKRTTPKFWLPTLTVAWGIVATLMGVTHNKAGFFVVRFL
jgi:hypothetical protein